MKNSIIIIIILTVLVNLYLLPEKTSNNDEVINYPNKFSITIMGEVTFPGNYDFYEPVTLLEVINYAGNLTKDADYETINFNEVITNNKIVYINKNNVENIEYELINLNYANIEELKNVVGVSERIAENIILYRIQNGRYNSVEDLINVKYIGVATFDKIKTSFTV